MPDPYTRERIENWVSDFCAGERIGDHPPVVREYAGQVLSTLLCVACDHRGSDPGQLEEADLRVGLMEGVAAVMLPKSAAAGVADLAADFLGELEREGRLAGGRSLGRFVRVHRSRYVDRATGRQRPDRRPSRKLGPNEPCPCGSGVKYKKCCRGLLD